LPASLRRKKQTGASGSMRNTTLLQDGRIGEMTQRQCEPGPECVLRLDGVSKRFGAVLALDAVGLRLRAGEVHALMGQNGAGKSTLIKLLTGVYPADSGSIHLAGSLIEPATPLAAQTLGISTVYQEVNLCPNLSIAENIFAGRYPRRGWAALRSIDWRRMERETRALLARLGMAAGLDVTQPLHRFSVAVQQMVAIARALSVRASVLILDEPTSSLDESEVDQLFAVMRRLRGEGLALLFVTHFLDQVYAVADRITVLRNGRYIGEWMTKELPAPALIAAMAGRDVVFAGADGHTNGAAHAARSARLSASGLGAKQRLAPTDLSLYDGEVVGVAGLLGSGRTELARLLFGLDSADSGQVQVAGRPVRMNTPAQAVRQGLAFCPEDRQAEGVVAGLCVRENIVLALQARQGLWPNIGPKRQQELADRYIALLGIKTPDADTEIGMLSGGNQQKVVLARWLAIAPRLLILDEPTRGIDVAAKQDLMNEVLRLARQGLSVLFISSEIEEVLRLSDRVLVMRDRRKAGELPGGCDEAQVLALIAKAAS
jgi:monosaccharide-transporting ATPase